MDEIKQTIIEIIEDWYCESIQLKIKFSTICVDQQSFLELIMDIEREFWIDIDEEKEFSEFETIQEFVDWVATKIL